MEDMHIHLKDAIYNQEIFDKYVEKCLELGLDRVVFLDHGNRISSKHKPVLSSKNAIDEFNKKISDYKKNDSTKKLKILRGIEIDYSDDMSFRKETNSILEYGKFEWVVGAIHSMKFDDYGDYLKKIISMINNYKINVIAHIKKSDDYYNYSIIFDNIMKLCYEKGIYIEINTSDRSRWDDNQLCYMLEKMEKYGINYVFSSDAHKYEDIGYMIEYMKDKVEEWKKRK